jgi:hypothetical protein
MKTDTNNELAINDLARRVYDARTNFTKLMAALEDLYAHYDNSEVNQTVSQAA